MVSSQRFIKAFLTLAILSIATIVSYPGLVTTAVGDDRDSNDAITTALSSSHAQFSRKDSIVPYTFDWSISNFLISIRVIVFALLLLAAMSRIEKSLARYFTGRSPPEIFGFAY